MCWVLSRGIKGHWRVLAKQKQQGWESQLHVNRSQYQGKAQDECLQIPQDSDILGSLEAHSMT